MHAKAKCLIVSANQVVVPYPVFPLGAAYVTGALIQAGHDAIHYDVLAARGLQGLEQILDEEDFDLVGLSIRNIDTVDSLDQKDFLKPVIEAVDCIRKRTSAPLVLGGPAFAIMPEQLRALLKAEYGIVGEGEYLLPWLAGELAAGTPPEKTIFYADRKDVPWNVGTYSSQITDYYTARGGMLNIQSKRGCPHQCAYCSYPSIEGRKVRYRDPEEVAEEFKRLHMEQGAKYLFFVDSVFNDSSGHHLEIAEALVRQGNKIPWCAYFRPQNIETKDLKLLKRAGLDSMEIGTDAASNATLEGLNKRFTFEDVVQIHERVLAEEIASAHFLIFGGPGETGETLEQGLKNVEKLDGSVVFAFIGIRVLPGTAMYERALQEKVVDSEQSLLMPTFYHSSAVSPEYIGERLQSVFDKKISRVFPCHQIEKRICMLHGMGHVGPLWDLLLK